MAIQYGETKSKLKSNHRRAGEKYSDMELFVYCLSNQLPTIMKLSSKQVCYSY